MPTPYLRAMTLSAAWDANVSVNHPNGQYVPLGQGQGVIDFGRNRPQYTPRPHNPTGLQYSMPWQQNSWPASKGYPKSAAWDPYYY